MYGARATESLAFNINIQPVADLENYQQRARMFSGTDRKRQTSQFESGESRQQKNENSPRTHKCRGESIVHRSMNKSYKKQARKKNMAREVCLYN